MTKFTTGISHSTHMFWTRICRDSRRSNRWTFVALTFMTSFYSSAIASDFEITNGSFELVSAGKLPVGWNIQSFGHVITVEDAVLMIGSGDEPRSTLITQVLSGEQLLAGSLRFSGDIKTEGVQVSASLVAILRGGDRRLFMDDMRDRVVAGSQKWNRYSIDIPPIPDAKELEIGMLLIGPGSAWFDDLTLERLDDSGVPGEARAYVKEAVTILQAQYLHTSTVDWDAISASSIQALRDDSSLREAHGVVASIFSWIGDPHAQFVRPSDEEKTTKIDANIPSISAQVGSGIAYIDVPKWSSPADSAASAEYVSKAHRDIAAVATEVCGWVVDLTKNTGGNMWPMLAALGPLLGREEVGQFAGAQPSDDLTIWWYRAGISGARANGTEVPRTREIELVTPMLPIAEPIAVVVSSDTASSGEALAIAFSGRGNTRFFGQSTAGWATANVAIPLSDDGILVFPSGYMADSEGRTHPDGIDPDEIVDQKNAVAQAETWLMNQQVCRQHEGTIKR